MFFCGAIRLRDKSTFTHVSAIRTTCRVIFVRPTNGRVIDLREVTTSWRVILARANARKRLSTGHRTWFFSFFFFCCFLSFGLSGYTALAHRSPCTGHSHPTQRSGMPAVRDTSSECEHIACGHSVLRTLSVRPERPSTRRSNNNAEGGGTLRVIKPVCSIRKDGLLAIYVSIIVGALISSISFTAHKRLVDEMLLLFATLLSGV